MYLGVGVFWSGCCSRCTLGKRLEDSCLYWTIVCLQIGLFDFMTTLYWWDGLEFDDCRPDESEEWDITMKVTSRGVWVRSFYCPPTRDRREHDTITSRAKWEWISAALLLTPYGLSIKRAYYPAKRAVIESPFRGRGRSCISIYHFAWVESKPKGLFR